MKISLNKPVKYTTTEPVNSDCTQTETAYLLYSPANAEHLKKSIAQFKAGNIFKRKIFEE